MKIETKHIIIAIVAAVAVYLLYKRGVFGKKDTADTVGIDTVDPDDTVDPVEEIISISGMTKTDATKVRQVINKIEASPSWKESIENKAVLKGLSYEQMLVLDAFWTLYYNSEGGFKDSNIDETTKSYVWKVQSNIKNK